MPPVAEQFSLVVLYICLDAACGQEGSDLVFKCHWASETGQVVELMP